MYRIKFTAAYKKGYKRMKKRGANLKLLDNAVETLQKGEPLDARYHDHPLIGNYSGYRECHIQPNWLLIYLIEDEIITLTLTNTGTHADLFDL